jgi:hypothetical protein
MAISADGESNDMNWMSLWGGVCIEVLPYWTLTGVQKRQAKH